LNCNPLKIKKLSPVTEIALKQVMTSKPLSGFGKCNFTGSYIGNGGIYYGMVYEAMDCVGVNRLLMEIQENMYFV